MLGDYRIVKAHACPRMQLAAAVPVTPEFREVTNTWMAGFFGYNCVVERGQVVVDKLNRIMYVHPADYDQVSNEIAQIGS